MQAIDSEYHCSNKIVRFLVRRSFARMRTNSVALQGATVPLQSSCCRQVESAGKISGWPSEAVETKLRDAQISLQPCFMKRAKLSGILRVAAVIQRRTSVKPSRYSFGPLQPSPEGEGRIRHASARHLHDRELEHDGRHPREMPEVLSLSLLFTVPLVPLAVVHLIWRDPEGTAKCYRIERGQPGPDGTAAGPAIRL